MTEMDKKRMANKVLIAGVLFNLSIGVLYAWSILKNRMTLPVSADGWGWSSTQAGLPYTLCVVCFATGVLIGGRIQDKTGPRWVVTAGGFMVGLGLILSGLVGDNPTGLAVCFGVITGLGIGLGYGSITPTALKWFHPCKKGFVSGMVVGGFGLAAVYLAPLTSVLLQRYTIEQTFLYMGITVLIISTILAQFIKNPPEGYAPVTPNHVPIAKTAPKDFIWQEMVRTKRFYLLITLYLFSASMGLMIIGNITRIANIQADLFNAALLAGLVSFMAFMNFCGRVLGGMLSDKIGRVNALFVVFILQLFNMLGFGFYSSLPLIIVGIVGTGFCFGAILSIFPAITADQFGLKNYGQNYGIIYLFWGLSGVIAPVIADYFYDMNGNFNTAYLICAGLMCVVLGINYLLKKDIG